MDKAINPVSDPPLAAGSRLARGVARMLRDMGFAAIEELAPTGGLRVDLMARADMASDRIDNFMAIDAEGDGHKISVFLSAHEDASNPPLEVLTVIADEKLYLVDGAHRAYAKCSGEYYSAEDGFMRRVDG